MAAATPVANVAATAPAEENVAAAPAADDVDALRQHVEQQPRDYAGHVHLVEACRRLGDVPAARLAREGMSAHFPLTPQQWLGWLEDEEGASTSADFIRGLYDRATQDYLSVTIWLKRALFVLSSTESPDAARTAFDEAVAAAGLHVLEGGRLWSAYTQFEVQLLQTLRDGENMDDAVDDQADRVHGVYARRLAVPHVDLQTARAEYADWVAEEDDEVDEEAMRAADAAQAAMDALLPMEAALMDLADGDVEKKARTKHRLSEKQWAKWREYIAHEADPARVHVLFERIVADAPLAEAVWAAYNEFAEAHAALLPVLAIAERAARSCPWNLALWRHALTTAERFGAPVEQSDRLFAAACASGLGRPADYAGLFCHRLASLCRQLSEPVDEAQARAVRDLIAYAVHYCTAHAVGSDADDSVCRLCARVAALRLGDELLSAELFAQVLDRQATRGIVWVECASLVLEARWPDAPSKARAHYRRGVDSVSNDLEVFAAAWLGLETTHGTVADYDVAQRSVTARRAVLAKAAKSGARRGGSQERPVATAFLPTAKSLQRMSEAALPRSENLPAGVKQERR